VTPANSPWCTNGSYAYDHRVDLPQPSVVLGDQLCFSLYRASKAMTARYRPMLDELGITYPQLLVLMALWEQDDLTVREIGDRVDLDGGTISPMLKRLAAIGLVTRERSLEDERLVRIRLTEAGRAMEQPACGVSGHIIDALALDPARFAVLKRELDELIERVAPQG
jgi:DNA-binding MarR family transcriptional regulator